MDNLADVDMNEFDINLNVLSRFLSFEAYSSARDDWKGAASIYLDANENPFGDPYARYPDPYASVLKTLWAQHRSLIENQILIGNGSDECIDLFIRLTCDPSQHEIIICPPTYGMYKVCADLNNIDVVEVPLLSDFIIDIKGIIEKASSRTSIIFICSPNNPSGNSVPVADIEYLLKHTKSWVFVDEAYIDFSNQTSCLSLLARYKNLIVLQTLSKAWGLAGARIGFLMGNEALIKLLNAIKPPYNINQLSQEYACKVLRDPIPIGHQIVTIKEERERISAALLEYPFITRVFPSEANFVLVRCKDANAVYQFLAHKGIIVRNRHGQLHCDQCIRVSIGTTKENDKFLLALNEFSSKQ